MTCFTISPGMTTPRDSQGDRFAMWTRHDRTAIMQADAGAWYW